MKLKQKLLLFIGIFALFSVGLVVAEPALAAKCGGADTSIISCDQDNNGGGIENNGVWGILLLTINILTAGIGIVAVGGIVYGAILYASAGDKPDQIKKASGVITNVVIGLIAYVLLFAVVQYLIPGGVFNR